MSNTHQREPFNNKVVDWIDERLPVFTLMSKEYGAYPAPKNFNYFWNFGALAMFMLITMILTGVFLAMHYTPQSDMAFASVERIMRDVNWGWMMRYLHMNGASMFFIAVYIHIFRGMYYGSYKRPRELLWILGVIIFLLMMATAFMGYTLPWSQMSGWGATVITSLFSAVPLVGDSIVQLLWGGFSVDNPTLNRFFVLHFLLPFVIFGVVFLHVAALHITGSNNPLGIDPKGPQDTVPFHPYYTVKDMFGLGVFLLVYVFLVFFAPLWLTHPDHFVEYDPLVTPPHIVPEWYFLPFYAILRSLTFGVNAYVGIGLLLAIAAMLPIFKAPSKEAIPVKMVLALFAGAGFFTMLGYFSQLDDGTGAVVLPLPLASLVFVSPKLAGVGAMIGSIALLFVMPWLDSHPVRSARFRPMYKISLLLLVISVFVLGYVGAKPAEGFWIFLGQFMTLYYFAFFLVILPVLSKIEKAKPLPASINEAVLKHKSEKA